MGKLTLVKLQQNLGNILDGVEEGYTTTQDGVAQINDLRKAAEQEGVDAFKPNFTIEDLERLRNSYLSSYQSSGEFETSTSYESSGY